MHYQNGLIFIDYNSILLIIYVLWHYIPKLKNKFSKINGSCLNINRKARIKTFLLNVEIISAINYFQSSSWCINLPEDLKCVSKYVFLLGASSNNLCMIHHVLLFPLYYGEYLVTWVLWSDYNDESSTLEWMGVTDNLGTFLSLWH